MHFADNLIFFHKQELEFLFMEEKLFTFILNYSNLDKYFT